MNLKSPSFVKPNLNLCLNISLYADASVTFVPMTLKKAILQAAALPGNIVHAVLRPQRKKKTGRLNGRPARFYASFRYFFTSNFSTPLSVSSQPLPTVSGLSSEPAGLEPAASDTAPGL